MYICLCTHGMKTWQRLHLLEIQSSIVIQFIVILMRLETNNKNQKK